MGHRLLITLIVLIGLHSARGQEFVQHHVPNDSISPVEPLVRLLPNGGLWMAWLSWDTRVIPLGSRLHVRQYDPAGLLLASNDLLFPSMAPSLWLEGAAVLPDGGLALVGRFVWKALVVRMDANAQLAAANLYSNGTNEMFGDVAAVADDRLLLVGSCSVGTERWPWILRADLDGAVQAAWSDRFIGLGGYHQKVRNTADGGTLVLGQHIAGNAFSAMHVVKMDSLGQVEWGRLFTGPKLWPKEALQRPDGGWALMAGQQVQDSITHGAPVLFRLAADGTVGSNTRLWAAPVASTYQVASSMCRTPRGSLLVCAGVNALSGSAMITIDSSGVAAPWARLVPDSALLLRVNALTLDDGDLVLYGARYASSVDTYTPLFARWDTASAFPCGSGSAPVLTDSIVHGLSTMMEHLALNPIVEDITAQIVADTITWTVTDPCAIGTEVRETPAVAAGLRVFPNPAADRVQVDGIAGLDELLLLDTQGALVHRWSAPWPPVIELSAVREGLYLLRAAQGTEVRSARLVVQR
ncbi:MAG: hypothetical protein IPM68_04550 [Flavobacteriales bacterium]|nr:hypothetical protein [Flavobacteriales bacterium]